jgi:hypothetical protein
MSISYDTTEPTCRLVEDGNGVLAAVGAKLQ